MSGGGAAGFQKKEVLEEEEEDEEGEMGGTGANDAEGEIGNGRKRGKVGLERLDWRGMGWKCGRERKRGDDSSSPYSCYSSITELSNSVSNSVSNSIIDLRFLANECH